MPLKHFFPVLILFLSTNIALGQLVTPGKLVGFSNFSASTMFSLNTDGSDLQTHHAFSHDGVFACGDVVRVGNYFYNVTQSGGSRDGGTLNRLHPDGSNFEVVYNFDHDGGYHPQESPVYGNDDYLYGSTRFGGAHNMGTIYRVRLDGTDFEVLKHFQYSTFFIHQGIGGELMLGSDQKIYGMAGGGGANQLGVIFRLDRDGSNFEILKAFEGADGEYPFGTVVEASDGMLYGMTSDGGAEGYGVIFRVMKNGTLYEILHSFDNTHGSMPNGELMEHSNGSLYGYAAYGGVENKGVVFRIEKNGTGFEVLHEFAQFAGQHPIGHPTEGTAGILYGVANGELSSADHVLFSIEPDGSQFEVLTTLDGYSQSLAGSPVLDNGKLYITNHGTTKNFGSILSYELANAAETYIKIFDAPNGMGVQGGVVRAADGNIYGTTSSGGQNDTGALFRVAPDGSGLTVLKQFTENEGRPIGGVIDIGNGYLAGALMFGISANHSMIYKIKYDGSDFTMLHAFSGTDGSAHWTRVTLGANGLLYGVTQNGGANNKGVVYRIATDGSAFTVLHHFVTADGENPYGAVAVDGSGNVYGTTLGGGSNNKGTLFRIDANGVFTVLKHFDENSGHDVFTDLLLASNGLLYGTAMAMGSTGRGCIFRLETSGNNYTVLKEFNGPNGSSPYRGLIQAPGGELYGATRFGGGREAGTIFRVQPNGGGFVTLHTATQAEGYMVANLVFVADVLQAQTITFPTLQAVPENAPDITLTATASSGLPVAYESDNTSVAVINGDKIEVIATGTANITATQPGNISYAAATPVTRQLVVNAQLTQTIIFSALSAVRVNSPDIELTATATSGLPVVYQSSNINVAVISGNKINVIASGITDITATQPGNSNYAAATPVTHQLVVNPQLVQLITFNPNLVYHYGDAPVTLTATSTSGLGVTLTSGDPSVASINGNVLTIHQAGNVVITATQPGNNDYAAANPVARSFEILKAPQTISFPDLSPGIIGTTIDPAATASSSLPVTYLSSDSDIATITPDGKIKLMTSGIVSITASQAGNVNYHAAQPVTKQLAAGLTAQQISFPEIEPRTFGDAPFNPGASSTSGLTISYFIQGNDVAIMEGDHVKIVGAGTTIITASQAGNGSFVEAQPVSRVIKVLKKQQTILFPAIQSVTLGSQPAVLSATSTSGLPVAYSHVSNRIAIDFSSLIFINAGTATVYANQSGDKNYEPAPEVSHTFCINPAKPTIHIVIPGKETNNGRPVLASSAEAGLNRWFHNGVYINEMGAVLQPNDDGLYTVRVVMNGCFSEMSDAFSVVSVISGVEDELKAAGVSFYPNPVESELFVEVTNENVESAGIHIMDMAGRTMISETLATNKQQRLLFAAPAGLYLMRIAVDGKVLTIKVVKR